MPIFLSLTPTLAAAVTPLNYARYQFIYPEDNQVFGMSFNTNVGGTTVQGEIAYRPDFPLATSAGDQINQIADASGTTLALTAFGHDTYALSPTVYCCRIGYLQVLLMQLAGELQYLQRLWYITKSCKKIFVACN